MNKPNIITKLTEQVINELYIHDTIDSFRRFCAIVDDIVLQEETNDVPALAYVLDDGKWTIHSCMAYLLRWVSKKYTKVQPTPLDDVMLQWDPNHIGYISEEYPIDVFHYPGSNNGILIYNGNIKNYQAGNEYNLPTGFRVGAMVKFPIELLNQYPEVTVLLGWESIKLDELPYTDTIYATTSYESDIPYMLKRLDMDYCGFIIYPSVVLGMEIPIWFSWDKTHMNNFTIAVTNESNLKL